MLFVIEESKEGLCYGQPTNQNMYHNLCYRLFVNKKTMTLFYVPAIVPTKK